MTRDMDAKFARVAAVFPRRFDVERLRHRGFHSGTQRLKPLFSRRARLSAGHRHGAAFDRGAVESGAGIGTLRIFPIAVGISYLLTAEIAFSLWAFFLIFKLQYVAAYLLGFAPNSLPNVPQSGTKIFVGYQEVGAYLAYAAADFLERAPPFRPHLAPRDRARARQCRRGERSAALSGRVLGLFRRVRRDDRLEHGGGREPEFVAVAVDFLRRDRRRFGARRRRGRIVVRASRLDAAGQPGRIVWAGRGHFAQSRRWHGARRVYRSGERSRIFAPA